MSADESQIHGRFGEFGGRYVAESLVAALDELEKACAEIVPSPGFQRELDDLLANYAGRPTPLYFARRLTEEMGGAKIYLKREDLAHAAPRTNASARSSSSTTRNRPVRCRLPISMSRISALPVPLRGST